LHAAALNVDETHVNSQTKVQDAMELANLLSLGFSVKQLSKMYLVSEMTIRRRIVSFGMTNWKYDNIDNMDLENAMYDIKETHPDIGEKMMDSFLRAQHIRVRRKQLREAMHHIDAAGIDQRRRRGLHRRQYCVPNANALWHIDGNHKLIR
jgi:hypothetical protein